MNESQLKTPCFIIQYEQFRQNCEVIKNNFATAWNPTNLLCGYSIKTNNHPSFLQLAREFGFGAEAVSRQEFILAQKTGFPADKIILNGPFKEDALLDACLLGSYVNIDNFDEIQTLSDNIEKLQGKSYHLGIRINFNLAPLLGTEDVLVHTVGKFGLCYENGDVAKAIQRLRQLNLKISGLHMHIGTQKRSLKIYEELSRMVCKLIDEFQLEIDFIDIGGGFWGGAPRQDRPVMAEYAKTICNILKTRLNPEKTVLILEPGTSVLLTSAIYRTKVVVVKDIRGTKVAILDGVSMHINPFFWRKVFHYTIHNSQNEIAAFQDICGATTMENDRFFTLENAPMLQKGDIIDFEHIGAYTMSFNAPFIYPLPNVYLFHDDEYHPVPYIK